MSKRRSFNPEQKAEIVMAHLVDSVPISEICEQHQINPNLFYRWQAEFRQIAAAAFRKDDVRKQKTEQRKVDQLEEQLQKKDGIIAYVTTELMKSKKRMGSSEGLGGAGFARPDCG